jgi:hypothetical protein
MQSGEIGPIDRELSGRNREKTKSFTPTFQSAVGCQRAASPRQGGSCHPKPKASDLQPTLSGTHSGMPSMPVIVSFGAMVPACVLPVGTEHFSCQEAGG